MRVRNELLPSAISDCELVARSNGTDTQCRPAVGSAERLEDVEKVVRDLKREIFELHQFIHECLDHHVSRIERLESRQGGTASYRVVEAPPEHW